MINLYQILKISPHATDAQIRVALQRHQNQNHADPRVIQAVEQWLLVPQVRQKYDLKLRTQFPQFFQAAQPRPDNSFVVIENDDDTDNMTEYEYVPQLWQPTIAVVLGLIVSPMVGAWLHAQNWRELDNEKWFKWNMNFLWTFVVATLVFAILKIVTNTEWVFIGDAILWLIWFVVVGKRQLDFVRNTLNNDYDQQSWLKFAGMMALACFVFFVVVVMLIYLAVIAGVAHPNLFD